MKRFGLIEIFFIIVGKAKQQTPVIDVERSSTNSSISTNAVLEIVDKLRREARRESMRKNYYSVWKNFNQFHLKLDIKPSSWEERITLYAGYLIDQNKKATTVKSYISAIKAVLLEIDVEVNENRYLLSSLTKACRYVNAKVRTRLPIYKELLQVILNSTNEYFLNINQPYLACFYKAIFAVSYYGLLRVGEVTTGSHPIAARNVHIATNKDKILFILFTSKTHWMDEKPQLVKISGSNKKKSKKSKLSCPFELLRNYLTQRKSYKTIEEPFFVFRDRTPVKPMNVTTVLKDILRKNNFNESLYSMHSFRTGRASDLLKAGVSVETIKKLGRWKSNSVYKYLR